MSQSYFQFHQQMLQSLHQTATSGFANADLTEEDNQLLDALKTLSEASCFNEELFALGQHSLCRIVAAYPLLAPQVPRDLFWLFGGDCLHFMPDEEIQRFQQLDELRFEAENNNIDYQHEKERARLIGLH